MWARVGARAFRYTLECSQSLLNPHSASKTQKPLIFFLFFAVSLPGREPLLSLNLSLSPPLSLSAGMNAHVEMLARFHTRTKFSHTKARGERGGRKGWKREVVVGGWGVGDERASRRKIKGSRGSAPLTPPPRFIKICLPIPTLFSRNLSLRRHTQKHHFCCLSVYFPLTLFSHEVLIFF